MSAARKAERSLAGTTSLRTTKRFRLTPALFGAIALLALFHLYLSRRPLWHTDLWGHLAYGRLIVAERRLPATEPLMPLSRGVPFVDLAWLSQVMGYLAFQWEGIRAIQFLYAGSITTCIALLAYRTERKTGAIGAALLAAATCVWLEWQQFLIVRPQLAGLVCFVALFVYLTGKSLDWKRWLVVPILFVAWANLHGSFAVGLGLIAALAAGRGIDVWRRMGHCRSAASDRTFRRLSVLLVPAAFAVLVNPVGWTIYRDIWETASNPNLRDLVEWRPLEISMWQGQAAAVVALALIVLYRLTPRRVTSGECLLLIGLSWAALRTSRMIVWWAPVAAYYLAIHAAATWQRFRRESSRRPATRLGQSIGRLRLTRGSANPFWALAALLTVCGMAAGTPLGIALLGGPRQNPFVSLSAETPIGAAEYLKGHPPQGQIFNAYEWGDYLLWAGPEHLRVFVASHAHLVPTDVWQDYLAVIGLRSGWEQILDRYGVIATVLDPVRHEDLVESLRASDAWSLAYEDDRSVIFTRRLPK